MTGITRMVAELQTEKAAHHPEEGTLRLQIFRSTLAGMVGRAADPGAASGPKRNGPSVGGKH